ncbi:MAG: hypothetical protein MUO62_11985 [Anaerolineales bacterium]|nr:hypothetical protein [Anaerolineales bacterium]
MLERLKSALSNISYLIFWIVLAALAVFVVFQIHATLIAIAIAVIENPDLRPLGWSMDTTYGLSRVFWLILGIFWLGCVMFTEGYFREGVNQKRLLKRFFLSLVIVGVIYGINYLVLLLLS